MAFYDSNSIIIRKQETAKTWQNISHKSNFLPYSH